MFGLFKSILGGKAEGAAAALSATEIAGKIAQHQERIAELKRKLPSAAALEAADKSQAWQAGMEAKIKVAQQRGDVDEALRIKAEVQEQGKKSERISKHVEQLREEILREEDQIELLERALAGAK